MLNHFKVFNDYLQLGFGIALSLLLLAANNAYSAASLNEKDYYINNFGIKNGNPFISVQGTAGGSFDPSMGDEGYEAYVFDTDKGLFQITVAQSSSAEEKPYYSVDHIISNQINTGACLLTEKTSGTPVFSGNNVELTNSNITFTKINKVYTLLVTTDDPDSECSTGEHINKVFSLLTKPAFT
jgi:hypothetical protein